MTIGKRIAEKMKDLNLTEMSLAKMTGLTQPTIHRTITGEIRNPRFNSVQKIAKALNVDMDWLWQGKESRVNTLKEITVKDDNFIEIPQFDIEASMGWGKYPPDFQQPVLTVTVDKNFFIDQGMNITSSSKLSIITGMGDSMEGTFNNGDPVVVNHDIQKLDRDGIYVFTLGDKLYLKRLQILPNSVRMISDNTVYPPYIIEGEELKTLIIHGKVLFAWNGRRV